jgi:hypothetical protein
MTVLEPLIVLRQVSTSFFQHEPLGGEASAKAATRQIFDEKGEEEEWFAI